MYYLNAQLVTATTASRFRCA